VASAIHPRVSNSRQARHSFLGTVKEKRALSSIFSDERGGQAQRRRRLDLRGEKTGAGSKCTSS